jgi:MFS family permease
MMHSPACAAVLVAKGARTLAYGFLGLALPIYLTDLGVHARGVGAAITLTLLSSAALTWAVRRPAERYGARVALLALVALSALAAVLLLVSREPWVVVIAAMLGNVAVSTGETGPFLTIEQVVIARATSGESRTRALSVYNLVGYAAAAVGSLVVGRVAGYRSLFALFLVAAAVQAVAYARLPGVTRLEPAVRGAVPSTAIIRRLAALGAVDSFAGGFVLQSLIAYFLHERFGLDLATLGGVFFGAQIVTAVSLLLAARAAARFGLLPTMVVSHLVSNVVLIAIAAAPAAWAAVTLLYLRQLLSQMDVPTRQAYVMAVVEDHEREAAASFTNLTRTLAQAVTPAMTGWIMQAVALSAPFVLGGVLKIVYDVLMYTTFKDVPLKT